ncbi:MAG TPA: hypothetical protein VF131_11760 [Blastocatellia bacterium]|nr:hypothetical protein [Blastocatellia bacterium]
MTGTYHDLTWLNSELGDRAIKIRDIASQEFSFYQTPLDQCEHGEEHCWAIEYALHHLIPDDNYLNLHVKERFYLLTAPWIMNMAWAQPQRLSDKEYHEIACRQLNDKKWQMKMGINEHEAEILSDIIHYHRLNTRLDECPEDSLDGPDRIRVRLLAAYLRLADAIHVDDTKGPNSLFYFLQDPRSPELFHWFKSKLRFAIKPKPNIDAIVVDVKGSISTTEPLLQRVQEELELYVDSVRNTLVQGGVTKYLNVNLTSREGAPGNPETKNEVDRLLREYTLSFPPNAGVLQELYISSIMRIVQQNTNKSTAVDEVKQVQAIAGQTLRFRPCHVAFEGLIREVERLLTQDDPDYSKVETLATWAENTQRERNQRLAQISEHGGRALQGFDHFLLFGFSNTIVQSLKKALSNKATRQGIQIYVCEAHNKSSFDLKGRLTYIDGMNYARELKAALKEVMVTLIPDITVADVLSLRRRGRWVALFGTDGIDSEGKCGHTSGHLALAIIARHFEIPVYVICDSSKMGSLRPIPALERQEQWIKSVPQWQWGPPEEDIQLQNLRESITDTDFSSRFITEDGVFSKAQFINKYSSASAAPGV